MTKYINVYLVERHFGGREEGGWWYNSYECIQSVTPPDGWDEEKVIRAGKIFEQKWKNSLDPLIEWGDISSVNGGTEVRVYIEGTPKESETMARPVYS